MTHAFCNRCGSPVYQHPHGATFRATFPPTYMIEDGASQAHRTPSELTSYGGAEVSHALPAHMLPACHTNYESRNRNWDDSLPKLKDHKGPALTNDGDLLQ